MGTVIIGVFTAFLLSIALYSFLRWRDLKANWDVVIGDYEQRQSELDEKQIQLDKQIKKLEKYKDIPDIIDKSRKLKEEIESRIAEADKKAEQIINQARIEARKVHIKEIEDAEWHLNDVKETTDKILNQAKNQAEIIKKEAKEEAKSIIEESKLKNIRTLEAVDKHLQTTILYCRDMRMKAEKDAERLNNKLFKATNDYEFYEKAAQAMKNVIEGYGDRYMNVMSGLLDELADDFGFDQAGSNLKIARERTKKLIEMRMAATSDYAEVGRKEFAMNFVLDAFNGKIDTILTKAKQSNYEQLRQEIKDSYILVNVNGKGFRNSRITKDYLDSRLDELKWLCVVHGLKVRQQEEQRAIREQIRDEQKAKREYERAIKQAKKEEEMLEKALSKARKELEIASIEERNRLEQKIAELQTKLQETDGYIKRTLSLAEQTKQGNVYIISNVGSFGENVFKIGLTRRLNPMERINELGDASVPFRFDCHAIIPNENAPALEYALHQKFLKNQVNKVNRRKEFFKINLSEIRNTIEKMNLNVKWTMIAEATEFKESQEIDKRLEQDDAFRKQWTENQLKIQSEVLFDEDEEMQLSGDES